MATEKGHMIADYAHGVLQSHVLFKFIYEFVRYELMYYMLSLKHEKVKKTFRH